MNVRHVLLATGLAAGSLAAPAAAEPQQNLVFVARATSGIGARQVHGTCVARTDQWTADYGATSLDAVAVAQGATRTTIRCELFGNDYAAGDVGAAAKAAVARVSGSGGYVNRDITVCVTATADFRGTVVSTPRSCS